MISNQISASQQTISRFKQLLTSFLTFYKSLNKENFRWIQLWLLDICIFCNVLPSLSLLRYFTFIVSFAMCYIHCLFCSALPSRSLLQCVTFTVSFAMFYLHCLFCNILHSLSLLQCVTFTVSFAMCYPHCLFSTHILMHW